MKLERREAVPGDRKTIKMTMTSIDLYPEGAPGTKAGKILGLDEYWPPDTFIMNKDRPFMWFALWYAGSGESRGLVLQRVN